MVSLNTIRDEIAKKLNIKPRGLSIEEFRNIAEMLLQSITTDEQELFTRFDYWMRHSDRSAQIICANIELVRFGVLSARPQQKSKKSESKNSDGYTRLSFIPRNSDLKQFLDGCSIEPLTIKRLPETVELRAQLIDKWVAKQIDSKKRIDLLESEDITEETNDGNKRTQSMEYISYEDLVRSISRSKNASSLRDYAMNLMAVFKIYSEELIIAKDNALDEKDTKIDELINEVKSQSEKIANLHTDNVDLKGMVKDLLNDGKTTHRKLDIAIQKIDVLTRFTKSFAHMTLIMWVGSSVMKTQLTNLLARYNHDLALQHLKVVFIVVFRSKTDGMLKIYFCNTNFSDVGVRIKVLHNRTTNYHMISVNIISLASCEINVELAMFRGVDFEGMTTTRDNRHKAFDIELEDPDQYESAVNAIIKHISSQRLQLYQSRMDRLVDSNELGLDDMVLGKITIADNQFFNLTRPFGQLFLNCYIKVDPTVDNIVAYRYVKSDLKTKVRSDLSNIRITDRIYALRKIEELMDTTDGTHVVDDILNSGSFTDANMSDLRAIAEVEGIEEPEDIE